MNQIESNKRMLERYKKMGIVKCCVLVPSEHRNYIIDLCKSLRQLWIHNHEHFNDASTPQSDAEHNASSPSGESRANGQGDNCNSSV